MDKIAICVCTYKRDEKLLDLIESINTLKVNSLLIDIIVVNNYPNVETKNKILEFESRFNIIYEECKEKGISNARNLCVEIVKNKQYNYFAFLDDDEIVSDNWLEEMYKCAEKYNKHIICGPVITKYNSNTPSYIIKSEVFERKRFKTGFKLSSMGAGNVFCDTKILSSDIKFDSIFNQTGGEDIDFFRRIIKEGYEAIWCDEAIIFEELDISRAKLSYIKKRSYISGSNIRVLKKENKDFNEKKQYIKCIVKILINTVKLIFTNIIMIKVSMKSLTKIFESLGELNYLINREIKNLY